MKKMVYLTIVCIVMSASFVWGGFDVLDANINSEIHEVEHTQNIRQLDYDGDPDNVPSKR